MSTFLFTLLRYYGSLATMILHLWDIRKFWCSKVLNYSNKLSLIMWPSVSCAGIRQTLRSVFVMAPRSENTLPDGALQFGLLFTSSPSRDCPLWHHMPAEWAVMDRSLKSVAVMTLTTLTAQLPLQKVTEGSLCEPIRDQSNSTGSDVWIELSQQTFSAANELMLTHK